jgi:hypothetical protein
MKAILPVLAIFLVPKKELSAKLVFDNVRNYLIAATFFAMANWLRVGAPAPADNHFLKPAFRTHIPYLTELAVASGTVLLVLCTAQSLELARRGFLAFRDAMLKYYEAVERHPSPVVGILGALAGIAIIISSVFAVILFYLYAVTTILSLLTFAAYGGRAP